MELFIKVDDLEFLPSQNEIKKVMWEQANNISHSLHLKQFNSLSLSWDKWLDDCRWANGVNKSFEHINFEITGENNIVVDIADDALFVDKRAFFRGALYICEKANGKISIDNLSWYKPNEFRYKVRNYINSSFNDAVEKSYRDLSY